MRADVAREERTMSIARVSVSFLPVLLVLGASACATIPPTDELVAARNAYELARTGAAGQREPDEVHDAKKALAAAEREHDRDPGSTREADLAYIAHRKSLEAMALARQGIARDRIARAEREEQTVLTGKAEETNRRLARALEQSKQEAAAADERARRAIDTLHEVASIRRDEEELRISIDGAVLFGSDSNELMPLGKAKLDRVASALIEQGDDKSIVVEGHTDSRGSDMYNEALSQRRAEAVRDYLASKGVPMERMRADGKGESFPLATNDTATGRANNRRVEIVVRDREENR
jgi:outer membrane protein OmpA-like peptidoglycan-associated protein